MSDRARAALRSARSARTWRRCIAGSPEQIERGARRAARRDPWQPAARDARRCSRWARWAARRSRPISRAALVAPTACRARCSSVRDYRWPACVDARRAGAARARTRATPRRRSRSTTRPARRGVPRVAITTGGALGRALRARRRAVRARCRAGSPPRAALVLVVGAGSRAARTRSAGSTIPIARLARGRARCSRPARAARRPSVPEAGQPRQAAGASLAGRCRVHLRRSERLGAGGDPACGTRSTKMLSCSATRRWCPSSITTRSWAGRSPSDSHERRAVADPARRRGFADGGARGSRSPRSTRRARGARWSRFARPAGPAARPAARRWSSSATT